MEPVIELVYEGLYMLRVELSFLVALGFLWVAGQAFSGKARPDVAKVRKAPCQGTPSRRQATSRRANVDELVTPSSLDAKKLQDSTWIVAQVTSLCRSQVQRALELYRVAVRAGLNIKDKPWQLVVSGYVDLSDATILIPDACEV